MHRIPLLILIIMLLAIPLPTTAGDTLILAQKPTTPTT